MILYIGEIFLDLFFNKFKRVRFLFLEPSLLLLGGFLCFFDLNRKPGE